MKSRKPDKANFAVIRLYFSEIGTRKVTATCWHQFAGQSTFLSHFSLRRSYLPRSGEGPRSTASAQSVVDKNLSPKNLQERA